MNYYFEDQVRASERVLRSAIAARIVAEKQLRKVQVKYSGTITPRPESADKEIEAATNLLSRCTQEVLVAEKNHQKLAQGKKHK